MSLITKKNLPFLLPALLLLLLLPNFAEAQSGLEGLLWSFINMTFGRFMMLAGTLLDYSIAQYVIGFGRLYETVVGNAIDRIWEDVRDVFNMTFIFGLVYIGFKMILNSDDSNTKRWLINLIMAAVLVNFSLFFTKTVVDLSNIVATQIVVSGFSTSPMVITGVDYSISAVFMDNLGMTSLLGGSAQSFGYIFGSMILFIIAAFVFGAGAILLIIRFVVLLFYMVLSPFMFIGWVFPQLQRYTTEYWSGFLGRAFFAPIYILMLYFSAQVLGSMFITLGGTDYAAVLSASGAVTNQNFGGTLPFFAIACVFLIGSLVIAQKMGAVGAGAVMSAGRSATNRVKRSMQNGAQNTARYTRRAAGAATVGVAASAGRRSIGRLAYNRANDDKLKVAAASGSRVARVKLAAAQKVSQASFDPRSSKSGAWARNTGGYAATAKENDKKERQRAKDYERNPYDKDGKPKADFEEKLKSDETYNKLGEGMNDAKLRAEATQKELDVADEQLQIALTTSEIIANLEKKLEKEGDIGKRNEIRNQIATEQSNIKSQFEQQKSNLAKQVSSAQRDYGIFSKKQEGRKTQLEGEYKYENVNILKQRRERENQRWSKYSFKGSTVGAGGAGALAGAVVGSAVPIVGTAVGAIVGAIVGSISKSAIIGSARDTADARIATITHEYGVEAEGPNEGRVGKKKIKNQEEDNLIKKLKEKIAENDEGTNKPTKASDT